MTVNSDDPTFFGATLLDELTRRLTDLGFTLGELGWAALG